MAVVHEFATSLERGLLGEKIAKNFFMSRDYIIFQDLSKAEQYKNGYDFRVSKDGKVSAIEVKTDYGAERSGCLFWETKVDGEKGWTQRYKSDSKVTICWVIPYLSQILILPASKLRTIEGSKFRRREVQNPDYTSFGYLVPIEYIKPFCKVFNYGVN